MSKSSRSDFIRQFSCRSEAYDASQNFSDNPTDNPTFGDILQTRMNRRTVLKGSVGMSVAAALGTGPIALLSGQQASAASASFVFDEVAHGVDETHHVAPGYKADVLIRWGDPVVAGAPEFDPMNQTADAQEQQFGYNNDYLGFVPLNDEGTHGLLCVNHEYTNEELMFPGLGRQDKDAEFSGMTQDLVEIEMAAHGGSIVEIKKDDSGQWQVVADSKYGRRLTMRSTEMTFGGPAAGHERMKTNANPDGMKVIGMLNNCAGGITPWGTYVSGEENFHGYFWGEMADDHPEKVNYTRYGVPDSWYAWGKYFDRFDVNKEPREANRYGWVVETDPMDPTSTPIKRTALGRFKHEGAESMVNKDGRVVVYMGDDQRFDYLYKFITAGKFNPDDRAANMNLLDEGTLSVAKFSEDGRVAWLPLVHGEGPLNAENGFDSQADVVIEARRAADLLGATPMDRPEDVEPNPVTNKVYVMLTNNSKRTAEDLNPVNDRAENIWGQILEISPDDDDHGAAGGSWDILVKCGPPNDEGAQATWNPATSENGWFACPDNCAVDPEGRLWISTDQGGGWKKASGTADGVWAMETSGELRGTGKMFFRVPVGAEMCGPRFTPDMSTLFVAVQHVASDGTKDYPGFERASTFEDPATRWPDFDDNMPPRPSVVVITKEDGGKIGI